MKKKHSKSVGGSQSSSQMELIAPNACVGREQHQINDLSLILETRRVNKIQSKQENEIKIKQGKKFNEAKAGLFEINKIDKTLVRLMRLKKTQITIKRKIKSIYI